MGSTTRLPQYMTILVSCTTLTQVMTLGTLRVGLVILVARKWEAIQLEVRTCPGDRHLEWEMWSWELVLPRQAWVRMSRLGRLCRSLTMAAQWHPRLLMWLWRMLLLMRHVQTPHWGSRGRVWPTHPAGDVDSTADSDSSGNPAVEGVPCEGEGAGDSSNIVTRMKRIPRCRKPAAVHRTPYTDPTRHHGGRKKQKDLTDEGIGAEKTAGGDEPSAGEVATEILDVAPIAVERSAWGPDAEDVNTITLTK